MKCTNQRLIGTSSGGGEYVGCNTEMDEVGTFVTAGLYKNKYSKLHQCPNCKTIKLQ